MDREVCFMGILEIRVVKTCSGYLVACFFFFVGKSGLNGLERLRVVSQFIIICDS